jgi:hypothetical protein
MREDALASKFAPSFVEKLALRSLEVVVHGGLGLPDELVARDRALFLVRLDVRSVLG